MTTRRHRNDDRLTRAPGELSRGSLVPGMAYFRGTGPDHTFCSQCRFYFSGVRPLLTLMSGVTARHHCEKFREMTGEREPPRFAASTPSCKYFEPIDGAVM